MTFNTALSGLAAASADLRITGNNIANSSTVGFKSSRAQFADVYASTLLGSGANEIGSGVRLANVAQQFDQGTISFTDNALDLAIDGSGFFVLSDQGARSFTRAGMFGVDDGGFITAANGARVQGFAANASGTVSGVLGDLQIQTSNLAPARTTQVDATVNLDAREPVLARIGSTIGTEGSAIGVPQGGIAEPTRSVLQADAFDSPFDYSIDQPSAITAATFMQPMDFRGNNATFDVQLSGATDPNQDQVVKIRLDSNITSLQSLIDDIRDDLTSSSIGVDVRESGGFLEFYATSGGENSEILIDPSGTAIAGAADPSEPEGLPNGLQDVLGGIAMGSSNLAPGPNATGQEGNRSAASFDLTISGASTGNGTVTINLTTDIQNIDDLITDIRDDLAPSGLGVDVRRNADDATRLEFFATQEGEPSLITFGNIDASNVGVDEQKVVDTLNITGVSVAGVPAVDNGYTAQNVDVVRADGTVQTVTTEAAASAREIAARFGSAAVEGVSATATTTATIPLSGFNNASGTMGLSINGVSVTGGTLAALADSINGTAGLGTVSAGIDDAGDLVITDQIGDDLVVELASGGMGDSVDVAGAQGLPMTLSTGGTAAAAVGGSVALTLDEGITLADASPSGSNLFGALTPEAFDTFEQNTFDPNDQETYNAATSSTIFDSLGNPHTLTMFFVKDRFDAADPQSLENTWTMHVQVDGRDVGDPDPNLPPPQDTEPTLASFQVRFNEDGTLDTGATEPVLISNWVPLDEDGNPNGASGPVPELLGGSLPIADPPTSSNFQVRLDGSTQFGSGFALNSVDQNGFASGELSGLSVNESGMVDARFTNGESLTLGQVALADFSNAQGLQPVGDSGWVETRDSGEPVIAAASSGSLGAITSSALEDSNVDLSEQLVQMLIAQRNFQANARTITTSDEITQTIINL